MSVTADELDDPFGDLAGSQHDDGQVSEGPLVAETVAPRGAPVANGKRPVLRPAPPLPAWGGTEDQDRGDDDVEQIDYHDLASINRDLLHLRARMHRVRRGMRQAAREAVEAKLVYQRALRRALVQQSGGSAETRKASAELLCEDLEADMVMKQQIVDEYNSLFRAVRDDVENAKTVAYNLRSLMSLGG